MVLTSKLKGDESTTLTVTYHRRNLPDYLTGELVFGNDSVVTASDLLNAINAKYNLNILPSDIVDAKVEGETHQLTANEKSYEWCGVVTLTLRDPIDLTELLPVTQLENLVEYPSTKKGNAAVYSHPIDFTAEKDYLDPITINDTVDLVELAAKLANVVDEKWVSVPKNAANNLYGAKVIYDGPTAGYEGANTKFTRVLVLTLSPLCSNLTGNLLIHFNGTDRPKSKIELAQTNPVLPGFLD
ncbi:hypothetical protein LNA22_004662 [Salmonella enterica subsp. enterica serovar Bovismorbificans]|nr:hypothetical protein [Salmonella enterica subsp. enterica serovar Bovismorbificans]EIM4514599.1 hypothetical protein [Salmonella enterica subsp. enterica serovar Bovismorbificans]